MAGFKQGSIELRKKTVVNPSTGELMTVYRNLDDKIVLNTETGQEIVATETFVNAISADIQGKIDNLSGNFLGLTDTPNSYAGADTFLVAVSGNTLYFKDPATIISDTSGFQTKIDAISGSVLVLQTVTDGITGGLTQLDDRFVNVTGDIMTGDLTINADLIVNGDIIQISGARVAQIAETLIVEDNLVVLNSGETGSTVSVGEAGIQIDRGEGVPYQFMFMENLGDAVEVFAVGMSGQMQPVATREENPNDNAIAYWNEGQDRFDTNPNFTIDNIVNNTTLDGISGILQEWITSLETYTNGITGGLTQLDSRYVSGNGFITTSEVEGISSNLQGQIGVLSTDVNSISGNYIKSSGTTLTSKIRLNDNNAISGSDDSMLTVQCLLPTSFDFFTGSTGPNLGDRLFRIRKVGTSAINFESSGSLSITKGGSSVISVDASSNVIVGRSDGVTSNRNVQMYGNVTINDNLTVNGTTTTVNAENVLIEDNIITLNSNITGAPPVFLESGIKVNRGNQDPYYFIFRESDLTFVIGVSGSISGNNMQAVATRTDLVQDNLVYWDDVNKTLKDAGISLSNFNTIESNVTSLSGQSVTNASNISTLQSNTTGITGGLTQLDERYLSQGSFVTYSELEGISSNLQGQVSGLRTDVDSISGQLFTNTSGITGGLTQLDNRFVNTTGDIMTGTLVISGGQAYSASQILASSATINTNLDTGNVQTVTLSISGATLANPTNAKDGGTYIWIIKQPSSGSGFNLSYGTNFKFPSGTIPTLTSISGSADILSCVSDGTSLYCNLSKDFR